jgi:putative two-component system response regulator
LLSDRPYRKAWPEAKVIQYLKDISGKILDPKVVTEFFRMMNVEK